MNGYCLLLSKRAAMLLPADFIRRSAKDALVRMFQCGTSVSGRSISESGAQIGTCTADLQFSPQFEQLDWWPHTLLRSAGFGGAGVSPAIFACSSWRKTAGETPAQPTRAPCAR